MVDDNLRAKGPKLQLRPDIDESQLSDDEKKMLADLRSSQVSSQPPAELENVQLEVKTEESVTVLDASSPPTFGREKMTAGSQEHVDAESPPIVTGMDAIAKAQAIIDDPPELAVEEEKLDSGATGPIAECPHCGWDLAEQTIAEPVQDEKMGFLHSVLGQKTFIQEYSLFGGKVIARFRTLTTKEMDVIYNYVFRQKESGEIQTIQDYWEKVNRYRLYLQIIYLSATDGSFTHQLPDAYSKESNPHGTDFWQFPAYDPDDGYLDQIEDHILKEVLRTESIQRTISTYCARFNRLVSKLEAMIDNPDFWKETGRQS